jgi:hypothetical protein
LWVFLGAQRAVNRDGGPALPAPGTHTRTFLRQTAMELESKDTLWKSEFHSLLAKSSFLLGEGVCVCVCVRAHVRVYTVTETGGGRGTWAEGCSMRW